MYRKVWDVIARHKVAAAGLAVLVSGVAVAAAIAFLRTGDEAMQPPVSGPAPAVSADGQTNKPDEPAAEAGDPPASPNPSGQPEFRYAACPPDMKWYPDGNGPSGFTPVEQPARRPLEGIRHVSAGHLKDDAGYGMEFGASFALAKDGTVYRWGVLDWEPGSRPSAFPQKVEGLPGPVIQLDGRFVLTESGDVYDVNAEGGPKIIAGLSGAAAIAQAEDSSVYALGRDGGIKRYAMYGPDGKSVVEKVGGFREARSIAAGPYISLAIDKDGKLWKLKGSIFSAPNEATAPIALPDGARAKRVEATMSHQTPAYVLSDKGQWFRLTDRGEPEPAVVPDGTVQVTATGRTSVALKKDGTVWAWGDSPNLLEPEGHRVPPENPRRIAGLEDVAALAAGSDHLLALTKQGRVLTVGSNMYGQLGRMPVYAKDPLPIGTWRGIDGLFPVYGSVAARIGGDLWLLSGDGTVKPIVLGQKAIKAMPALGNFAVLTEDGRLLVAEPEETKPCKALQAPGPIIDADAAVNGLLLALEDGRVFHLEGSTRQLDRAAELKFEPEPAGKVIRVFGNPIPFVLTDQGELYFRQRTQDGAPVMKPVGAGAPIRQWSPMHYVYFDGIGFIGKALDERHQVYEIELTLNRDGEPAHETASVAVRKTGRTALGLTGGAEIGADGRILEQRGNVSIDTRLPSGIKLRATASFYHFPIEGRSFLYHLFAAEDGTLYWLGDLPYTGPRMEPGVVVLSQN